ncbi:MAG: class I SAM-dependent methyltransferase [Planctomycetaceae bacterium]|nr:class I SAM-dependent methyltransferase [Planctomycetaceae bacterium]
MPETVAANLYDYPKYYDLIFGNDWKAEYDFLLAAFEKHGPKRVRRLFEPACGTGRLLIKLAQAGYEVAGNDLNPKAVAFCNDRLARYGFPRSAVVGDMSDFRVKKPYDAAFNPINSFRHLPTEAQARSHLQCVARALRRGGLYLLGLHLTPTRGAPIEEEAWGARRGNLAVNSYMWTKSRDLKRRNEQLGMTFDVYTPTRQFRIEDEMHYRIYTARHMRALLAGVPELEHIETYDFHYDIDEPVEISPETEDVVLVLRKR